MPRPPFLHKKAAGLRPGGWQIWVGGFKGLAGDSPVR